MITYTKEIAPDVVPFTVSRELEILSELRDRISEIQQRTPIDHIDRGAILAECLDTLDTAIVTLVRAETDPNSPIAVVLRASHRIGALEQRVHNISTYLESALGVVV